MNEPEDWTPDREQGGAEQGGPPPGHAAQWQDRLVDAALHELHGSKPPDLTARVVLALQGQARGELPVLRLRRRPQLAWVVLAAAAALVLGAMVGKWLSAPATWSRTDRPAAQLEVRVFAGTLESVERAAPPGGEDVAGGASPEPAAPVVGAGGPDDGAPDLARGPIRVAQHTAGSRAMFCARAGNHLRAEAKCTAQIGPFGVLATGPGTDLEVHSMELTWKHGVALASTLTLAVVAGTATWYTMSRTETASAGEMLRLQADPDGSNGAAALVAENERLRLRVQELQQQTEAMQASRTKAPPPPVEEPPPLPPEPAVEAAGAMAFSDPRFAEALAKVDWKLVGDVSNEMGPLLAKLVAAMSKEGAEMPMDLAIQVSELNSKLARQVPAMMDAGLPGFGPNGAYTHPLVAANSIASTLEAAGVPLNDNQRAAIAGLVRAFSAENQSVVDGAREFDLEHLLAETELKDRFFHEVDTLLAPDQHGAAYPDGAGDYEGSSLFSSGVMTKPYASPIQAHDAAEFARIASNRLSEQIGFDEATAAKVRAVLERSASAPELWQHRAEPAELALQMPRKGRTKVAMQQQIAWMREIERQVPLTPEQRQKLKSMKRVLVPMPR